MATSAEIKDWKEANELAMVTYKGSECFNCHDTSLAHLMISVATSRSDPHRSPYVTYVPVYGQSWAATMAVIGQPEAVCICSRCYREAADMWKVGLVPFP